MGKCTIVIAAAVVISHFELIAVVGLALMFAIPHLISNYTPEAPPRRGGSRPEK